MKQALKKLLPYVTCLLILLSYPAFHKIVLTNLFIQIIIFILFAHVPAWKTKRMSYVDVAWPLGLFAIGLEGLLLLDKTPVSLFVSLCYLLAGARMGLFALYGLIKGGLREEFPRYRYKKIQSNYLRQIEISYQWLANCSFLFLPLLFQSVRNEGSFSWQEILIALLWASSFVMESVADYQKQIFISKSRKEANALGVCRIGLWNWCRHPNYFSEWMIWNSLMLFALGPAIHFANPILILATLYISPLLYYVLVYDTGAVPSEHFSALKRPEYLRYQKEVNRFFPNPFKV